MPRRSTAQRKLPRQPGKQTIAAENHGIETGNQSSEVSVFRGSTHSCLGGRGIPQIPQSLQSSLIKSTIRSPAGNRPSRGEAGFGYLRDREVIWQQIQHNSFTQKEMQRNCQYPEIRENRYIRLSYHDCNDSSQLNMPENPKFLNKCHTRHNRYSRNALSKDRNRWLRCNDRLLSLCLFRCSSRNL